MSGCTETGKPLISILMAVYEPRLDWLRQQLESLESQTYPNLKLYIRDDCSPAVPFGEIGKCLADCIRSFPYEFSRNEENLGSNGTFERLTRDAEGEYFAYCDQDDVWLPEKLAVLQEELEGSGALLACSDMYIIDGEGRQAADSITKVRRRHKFRSGKGLAPGLLISNFATGCTMLIRAQTAKEAVSFCPYMIHDHYMALFAAAKGEILSLSRPLTCYRIHGANQTSLMAGVTDKESYIEVRVRALRRRLEWLQERLPGQDGVLRQEIRDRLEWVRARERYLTGRGGAKTIWKYRRFNLWVSLFELTVPYLPKPFFSYIIDLARHNKF